MLTSSSSSRPLAIVLTHLVLGAPALAADEGDNPLIPEWEQELYTDHPADIEKARFVPGKGFEVRSADGRFKLQTRLRAQFLYELGGVQDEPLDQELMIRRARLQFGGNMWSKELKYKVEFAVSPRDMSDEGVDLDGDGEDDTNLVGTSPLLDWYVELGHVRDLNVRIGQYKVPFSRQRVLSSGDMQMVDRSAAANGEFNLDRDLGLDFRSTELFGTDKLRYYAGVYIGEGRNTSNRTVGAGDLGLMYIARVEVLPFGDFDDYSEGDLERLATPGLSLGAAYAYIDTAPADGGILGSAILGDVWDYHNANADVMFKLAGFSLLTEVFLRSGEAESGAPTLNGWGWMAQTGYLLPHTAFEVTGRYGLNRPLGPPRDTAFGEGINEVGGGVGHYFAQHPLKLQADLFELWDQEAGLAAGEIVGRVQLQVGM